MTRAAKIGIWIPEKHAKATYKNESYNTRRNAGMTVVADILTREGHQVEYASSRTIGGYDADFFVLGRAEGAIEGLISGNQDHPSIIDSRTFDPGKEYRINQVEKPYPHQLTLENGRCYQENMIGCPYACHFCGYSWHRKATAGEFRAGFEWSGGADVEMAMLDLAKGAKVENLDRLRTTAIDGMSERLRRMVNKPISRDILKATIYRIAAEGRKPGKGRWIILYNILGFPTETEEDWREFLTDVEAVDKELPQTHRYGEARGLKIVVHSTPFNAVPGTPLATAAMPRRDYRGALAKSLGPELEGFRIYDGRGLFVTDSQTVEGQATVSENAIMLRAIEEDTDKIAAWARTKSYDGLPTSKKQATLEQHFDLDRMHRAYTAEDLPTRYLRTHREIRYRTELNEKEQMPGS